VGGPVKRENNEAVLRLRRGRAGLYLLKHVLDYVAATAAAAGMATTARMARALVGRLTGPACNVRACCIVLGWMVAGTGKTKKEEEKDEGEE